MITLVNNVDELVGECPAAVGFLRDRNVVCIICGEVVWGTSVELLSTKGISGPMTEEMINDLNKAC